MFAWVSTADVELEKYYADFDNRVETVEVPEHFALTAKKTGTRRFRVFSAKTAKKKGRLCTTVPFRFI